MSMKFTLNTEIKKLIPQIALSVAGALVLLLGGYFAVKNIHEEGLSEGSKIGFRKKECTNCKEDCEQRIKQYGYSFCEEILESPEDLKKMEETPFELEDLGLAQKETSSFTGTIAFIRGGNLWVSINGNERQLAEGARGPLLSPNARKIAYLGPAEREESKWSTSINIINTDGSGEKRLVEKIGEHSPEIRWGESGNRLYYQEVPEEEHDSSLELHDVFSVDVNTGDTTKYGRYGLETGCGGGCGSPTCSLCYEEGSSVWLQPEFVLDPQEKFVLHSIRCSPAGIGFLDLTSGEDRVINQDIHSAVVDPSGERIAGFSKGRVLIFDTEGNKLNEFKVLEETTFYGGRLVWSDDGRSIYVTSTSEGKGYPLHSKLIFEKIGSQPFTGLDKSSIWRLSLATGGVERVIEIEAACLRIRSILDGGNTIIASEVENSARYYAAIMIYLDEEKANRYSPKTNVLVVTPGSDTVSYLALDAAEASFSR